MNNRNKLILNSYLKNSSDGERFVFEAFKLLFKLESQHSIVFHVLLHDFHGTSYANDENMKYKAQTSMTI